MPYFLDNPAASEVKAQLFQCESESHPPVYPRLVAWMPKEYATTQNLRDAYKAVVTLAQGEGEAEDEFAMRIRNAASRAGNVFKD